jgi:adenylate cyclase
VAHWHTISLASGLSTARIADIYRLFALAQEALSLDPRSSLALGVLGHSTSFIRRDCELGWQHLTAALQAGPGNAMAWTFASATLSYLGRGREAVEHAERGIRLSPYDSLRFYRELNLGIAHYIAGHTDAAERACRTSIGSNPGHAPSWRMLAAVLGGAGKLPEAQQAARRLLELEPGFTLEVYERERVPFGDGDRQRFLVDLRSAGVPA